MHIRIEGEVTVPLGASYANVVCIPFLTGIPAKVLQAGGTFRSTTQSDAVGDAELCACAAATPAGGTQLTVGSNPGRGPATLNTSPLSSFFGEVRTLPTSGTGAIEHTLASDAVAVQGANWAAQPPRGKTWELTTNKSVLIRARAPTANTAFRWWIDLDVG